MKKIIFLDCESAGLRGEIFAAALVGPEGETIFNGYYRHSDLITNSWLAENVAPNLDGQEFPDRSNFLAAAAAAYRGAKEIYGWEPWGPGNGKAIAVCAHMGAPVEANFFQQLWENGNIDEFSGPYPMLDTAPLILLAGLWADNPLAILYGIFALFLHVKYIALCDPTSEEDFAKVAGLELPQGHKTHNALSDARLTRLVWQHFTEKII